MYFSNPRPDQFYAQIPKNFHDKDILDEYNKYLKRFNGMYDSFIDVIQESIISFEIPGFGFETITVPILDGEGKSMDSKYLPNTSFQDTVEEKTVLINFRMLDGYINWFYLFQHFNRRYRDGKPFDLHCFIYDSDEYVIFSAIFRTCYFNRISPLELNYQVNETTFKDFQCTFTYNAFELTFDVPMEDVKNKPDCV